MAMFERLTAFGRNGASLCLLASLYACGGGGGTARPDVAAMEAVGAPRTIQAVAGNAATTHSTAITADGSLAMDRKAWLARNNLVYNQAITDSKQFVPMGSGVVGAALWNDPTQGLTVSLARPDSTPLLVGVGKINIPALAALSQAGNYLGILSLADGIFRQSNGSLKVNTYMRALGEELVIDVSGADPSQKVTVELSTWGENPTWGHIKSTLTNVAASDASTGTAVVGVNLRSAVYPNMAVAQLIAARAFAQNVSVANTSTGASLSFYPTSLGLYRVVLPVKMWQAADSQPSSLKSEAIAAFQSSTWLTDSWQTMEASQTTAMAGLWDGQFMLRMHSSDGAADYMEAFAALAAYQRIASGLGNNPGTGGGSTRYFVPKGIALFTTQDWYQNTRDIVYGHLGTGFYRGNNAIFDMYLRGLPEFIKHARKTFPGYEGACLPENLSGGYNVPASGDIMDEPAFGGRDCAEMGYLWYHGRSFSTGLEIVSSIYETYQHSLDKNFLIKYWPLVSNAMLFHRSLLMSNGLGSDGKYHFKHVNDRETSWDVDDDALDIAYLTYLLPRIRALAPVEGDTTLAAKLADLVGKIPALPTRTKAINGINTTLLGKYVTCYQNCNQNAENNELDAIWPANLFNMDSSNAQMAKDSITGREYIEQYDWHPTMVLAARMGQPDLMQSLMLSGMQKFICYANGFGSYGGGCGDADLQMEWAGLQAYALSQAMVQYYDGILRLAPAWPKDWDGVAQFPIEHKHVVTAEVYNGSLQAASVRIGNTEAMTIRNPWPGQAFQIVVLGGQTLDAGTGSSYSLNVTQGQTLIIQNKNSPLSSFAFKVIADAPATLAKSLGSKTLGILPPSAPDANPNPQGVAGSWGAWSLHGGQLTAQAGNEALTAVGTVTAEANGINLAQGYLLSPTAHSYGTTTEFTLTLSVKPDEMGRYRRLIDMCDIGSTCTQGFLLDLTPDNRLRWIGAGNYVLSSAVLTSGVWANVRVTYAAGAVQFWVNDALLSSTSVPAGKIDLSSKAFTVVIGADRSGGSRMLGLVANVAITPKAPNGYGWWSLINSNAVESTFPDTSGANIPLLPAYTITSDGNGVSLNAGFLTQSSLMRGQTKALTVEFEVKAAGSGYRRLVDSCSIGSPCNTGFLVDLTPSNQLRFIGAGQLQVIPVTLDNNWNRVKLIYGNQLLKLYLNDRMAWQGPMAATAVDMNTGLQFLVGADQSGGSRMLGSMAQVRVSPGARELWGNWSFNGNQADWSENGMHFLSSNNQGQLPADGAGVSLANAYLTTSSSGVLGRAAGLTIDLWAKLAGPVAYKRLVDWQTAGDNRLGFVLDVTPQNQLRFIAAGSTLTTPVSLTPGEWTRVTAVFDRGAVELYLNGKLQWSGTTALAEVGATTARNKLVVGADQGGGSRMTGSMALLRITPMAVRP